MSCSFFYFTIIIYFIVMVQNLVKVKWSWKSHICTVHIGNEWKANFI